jgi:hypothetical protein
MGVALWLGRPPAARAAPPLVHAHDVVAQQGLEAWWRPGDLLLVATGPSGREAWRPLADDPSPHPAPPALPGWTRVGAACAPAPTAAFTLAGKPARAWISGPPAAPEVRVERDGVPVAAATLGQPASVCALHVGEADAVPGLEIVVTWTVGGLQGLTVLRVPEVAH